MPRPKGMPKTGGKQKGTPNKATVLRKQQIVQQVIEAVLNPEQAGELTPLLVMRSVMQARLRNGDLDGALQAAALAAPYCHPRLASSDVRIRSEYADKSDAEIAAELHELEAKLAATRLVIDGEAQPVQQTH